MKTKIEIKYPKGKISKLLNRTLSVLIDSDELAKVIGDPIVQRIKYEAKRTSPLNDAGSFKSLAPSTIENRKHLKQFNKTTSVYKADRSNLSFTGQLLNSISWKRVRSDEPLKLLIFFDGKREMYNTGPKSKAVASKYNRTNEALAKTLKDIGFVVFSKKGIENKKELVKRVTNGIRSYIRKKLR